MCSNIYVLTYRGVASCERIATKSAWAAANRIVINHLTLSVNAAGSWTWIHAFIVQASLL